MNDLGGHPPWKAQRIFFDEEETSPSEAQILWSDVWDEEHGNTYICGDITRRRSRLRQATSRDFAIYPPLKAQELSWPERRHLQANFSISTFHHEGEEPGSTPIFGSTSRWGNNNEESASPFRRVVIIGDVEKNSPLEDSISKETSVPTLVMEIKSMETHPSHLTKFRLSSLVWYITSIPKGRQRRHKCSSPTLPPRWYCSSAPRYSPRYPHVVPG